jgi:serine phosphatase RsbU (regulator of sigma subunit)/CHASE2 domain-containing sensor protein
VTAPGERGSAIGEFARIRLLGATLLIVLVALTWLQVPGLERLQAAWFDAHQVISPRQVGALSVTVVEIDQKSLLALGQWPWPRTQLARLVDTINRAEPAAIGVNVLMPEADALSPEHVLTQVRAPEGALAAALAALPSNDAVLARSLADAPAVLVIAGTPDATGMKLRAAPITVRNTRPGADAPPGVVEHAGVLASIDELDQQAAGWGLISVDTTRGVVRRIPLVASINGTLVPTLAIEMLRVAYRARSLRLTVAGSAVTGLEVGKLDVPTEADGAVRVYYSPHRADRFVSAADVLAGKIDPALLHRQLVLIGPSAIGLHEFQDTPLGERMSGSEIQAQLLENMLDATLLHRPSWAPVAEALALLLLGAVLVWITPRTRPLNAALLMLAFIMVPVLGAFAVFRSQRLLFDAATPGLGLLLLFGVLLLLTLAESTRRRKALESVVQAQREQSARIAGELEAAQRIQTGSLPRLDLLRGDRRIELHATLVPAREVGGDLYDFFLLDPDRLFILIGDVAGKGLSASIFMAVSKALYKSAMLRAPRADIGDIMSVANAEVSRDNPEMLFVTVFAAILDLRSGALSYCNAGHDNPYRLRPAQRELRRIEDGDGPPLCALADFAYRGAQCQLATGELLCLMTDGVAEAQNAAGALYGQVRVQQVLAELNEHAASAREVVARLHADVLAFAGNAEVADDLTILALRWAGPRAP